MTTKLSPLQLRYLALWRKAAREGEAVFPTISRNEAFRLRMALYNAVRSLRAGDYRDAELEAVIASHSVRVEDAAVAIRPRTGTTVADIDAFLGDGLDALLQPPMTAEEAEAAESLARVMERAGRDADADKAERPTTPYFKRED